VKESKMAKTSAFLKSNWVGGKTKGREMESFSRASLSPLAALRNPPVPLLSPLRD
jgi:hypothetical protein